MQFAHGNNLPRIKISNQSAILQMIYHCGPIKRTEIAEQLDLTLPTITTNVSNMIRAGLVCEVNDKMADGHYPGRRARPVDIVPRSRYFVGVEMQGWRRTVCVLDFRGETVCALKDETPLADYGENISQCTAMIRQALQSCHLTLEQIAGIGVGVPGLVNSADGTLDAWPGYGWKDRPLRADLASGLGYSGRFSVENNVCARAYGARLSRRALLNDTPNFAYLFISRGIACPFFMNTSNAFGSMVGAGELGHMVVEQGGLPCSCGNRGCLEAYASDRAVAAQCAELLCQGRAPLLRRLCPDGAQPGMEQIIAAQRAGDRDVERVVDRALSHLGVAVANLCNFASPRILLIEGVLFQLERNRQSMLDTVHRNLCNVVHTDTEFEFIKPNEFGGAGGAAALAICKFLEFS